MKVILLQDVARIGKKCELKEVPTGHALNFLIPRNMAEPATPENVKRLKERQARAAEETLQDEVSFKAALEKLGAAPVVMQVEANEQGHLFKGIKAEDISAHLKHEGIAITAQHIHMEAPIKEVGDHEISVQNGELQGSFTLTITNT